MNGIQPAYGRRQPRVSDSAKPSEWNAVFTDKKDNLDMSASDFLKLMIEQLKNQDFMKPMDDTQYVTQMAQFASMQAMSEITEYSKSAYAMSMVGKTVTASRMKVNGQEESDTGVVQQISLKDHEYTLMINGKRYSLSQVSSVSDQKQSALADVSAMQISADKVTSRSLHLSWPTPTEDTAAAKNLSYKVYYSSTLPASADKAEKMGTYAGEVNGRKPTEEDIYGLQPDSTYYFTVVLTDKSGHKAMYNPLKVHTSRI